MRTPFPRRSHVGALIALAIAVSSYDGGHFLERAALHAVQSAPGPDEKQAEAGVHAALLRYAEALESLDADAVKKIQPSIPVASLAKAFNEMRELTVEIDAVRVLSVDGATARVSCRVTQTLTPKAGSRQTTSIDRVLRLRRDADSWVIDGFER